MELWRIVSPHLLLENACRFDVGLISRKNVVSKSGFPIFLVNQRCVLP